MLDQDSLQRIQQIQAEHWLPHMYATRVLEELELVYNQPQISGAPIGRSIIGRSGSGKTTILKRFVRLHASAEDLCPPLYVNMPPGPDLGQLMTSILIQLNDFKPRSGVASDKVDRVTRILEKVKPPMIIIDEAQNLDKGTEKQAGKCINAIKAISNGSDGYNSYGTPTILAGTSKLISVIEEDDQYLRRWRPVKLDSYPYGNDFIGLVNAMILFIPLNKQEKHLSMSSYKLLYKYSEGVIGLLKEILINATTNAIRDGLEKITIKHIRPILDID